MAFLLHYRITYARSSAWKWGIILPRSTSGGFIPYSSLLRRLRFRLSVPSVQTVPYAHPVLGCILPRLIIAGSRRITCLHRWEVETQGAWCVVQWSRWRWQGVVAEQSPGEKSYRGWDSWTARTQCESLCLIHMHLPASTTSYRSVDLPLSPLITPSLFHFRLKTYTFHKIIVPTPALPASGLTSRTLSLDHFFWASLFCF